MPDVSCPQVDAAIATAAFRPLLLTPGGRGFATANQLSSIGGVLGSLFPFGRLPDRRREARAGRRA